MTSNERRNALLEILSMRRFETLENLAFEFGVSHSTVADLFAAFHQCERKERAETILTLDLQQRGLGTGSCGPQTLPQYELSGKAYRFAFTLELL